MSKSHHAIRESRLPLVVHGVLVIVNRINRIRDAFSAAMHGPPFVSNISNARELSFLGAKLAKKHEAIVSGGICDPFSTVPQRKLLAGQLS